MSSENMLQRTSREGWVLQDAVLPSACKEESVREACDQAGTWTYIAEKVVCARRTPCRGVPALERNHPYHFKMDPLILLGPKCNHDIGIMAKFPVLSPEQVESVVATAMAKDGTNVGVAVASAGVSEPGEDDSYSPRCSPVTECRENTESLDASFQDCSGRGGDSQSCVTLRGPPNQAFTSSVQGGSVAGSKVDTNGGDFGESRSDRGGDSQLCVPFCGSKDLACIVSTTSQSIADGVAAEIKNSRESGAKQSIRGAIEHSIKGMIQDMVDCEYYTSDYTTKEQPCQ